jgi:hypothetical protein
VGLGAGRRVVHAHHARRDALTEPEDRLGIRGVDRRRQAVPGPVGQLDRLIQTAERRDAHDGAERLLQEDLVVRADAVDDHRVVVQAFAVHPPGRAGQHAVVRLNPAQILLVPLGELVVEQRPVQHVAVRVSDGGVLHGVREPGEELVVDVLVHDDGAEGGAPLARRAEPGEQGALHGQVEIGVRHDDHRVLAAELQAGRLQVPAAQLADRPAHSAGAGEAHLLHRALAQREVESLVRGRAVGEDDVQNSVGQPGRREQPEERVSRGGGVLRRLPHHGVAAQQCGHEVPRRDRHREVAGRDHGCDAHRDAEGEQALVRHLGRHGLAVQAAALTKEEVAGVDDFPHLAERLGIRLADLLRDQPRQGLGVGLDEPADGGDHPAAHRRGNPCPLPLRGSGRTAGAREHVRAGEHDRRDGLRRPRRIDRLIGGARRDVLPSDHRNDLLSHR